MATYDFPPLVFPSSSRMQLEGNTGLSPSPLIASAQTIDRGGLKWILQMEFANKHGERRGELMSLIAKLRGQANRVRIKVPDDPALGDLRGTPLVNGASQTGNALVIDGCQASVVWIKEGTYFSVEVNGEHELKMATADASTNGSGQTTLTFEPRLRASPANNAPIFVRNATVEDPEGVFVMAEPSAGWDSRPFRSSSPLSHFTLVFVEDVFATQ